MTQFVKERIELDNKDEVMKLHLIIKCFFKNIRLSNGDLDSIIELYKTGYGTKFFKNCVTKGFYKSEQTVRNAVSKMTALGVLEHVKRGERVINKEFLPKMDADELIMQYLVGNVK